jgi:hypothetical protein
MYEEGSNQYNYQTGYITLAIWYIYYRNNTCY